MKTIKIFTDNIGGKANHQVYSLAKHPAFKDSDIRIMPDVHAGAGCVIGFTANLGDKVVPNIVGVDIGCGVLGTNLGNVEINYALLDSYITMYIPSGFKSHTILNGVGVIASAMIANLRCIKALKKRPDQFALAIGSLGGGNHFIEVAEDELSGNKWLIIHSGSRNLGHQVASYYQRLASAIPQKSVPKEVAYLDGQAGEDYLHDMKICQRFAELNREEMMFCITDFLGMKPIESIDTIHNYIDSTNMVRKGAISAHKGENVLIPMNMRDGTILGIGKGNPDWNFSAPHGAGRLMSRGQARRELSMDKFTEMMQDVHTTSVVKATLDESPEAYKPMEEIIGLIGDTVDILAILKPIYNYKAK
jgi:RNA-splicing ligase RtcB